MLQLSRRSLRHIYPVSCVDVYRCEGLCLGFKYNYCQQVSSGGLAHYNCSFIKCETVTNKKKGKVFYQ